MALFWVAIYRPDGYDPASAEGEAMAWEIDALNAAMVSAGARVFVGGLGAPCGAMTVSANADGGSQVRAGPYLRDVEHVGGFWVLEAASMEEALSWGRKAAAACRAPVEVRPFN